MKRDLKTVLRSIGDPFGLVSDCDRMNVNRLEPSRQRGPSKWLEIHDDANAYGKDFDFRVMDGNVVMPVCEAAAEYFAYVLPEGLDRYSDLDGNHGYRIPNGLDILLDAAGEDGLLSEERYVENMNEDEQARHA